MGMAPTEDCQNRATLRDVGEGTEGPSSAESSARDIAGDSEREH